ncbi:filamentous hemagglutinin [Novimethylophilus kurashikiensis]|uniref:Filamentous hemagglutinin n=1 Tax=Novimethylophilus kurashikiensis TaxID=1825523 RepID=A0A2R5F821_9PROT|nr:hypothetical protein [Novimethylophilus kurashikiensis]GBG14366.1 filamentous hemagglutinin [Novimethylophilus kurashikiensis]
MSATGFLLAESLSEAFRKPYHQGDTNITVQYLIEGLAIGEYRVMLKRDFDTACWIPPVGRRGSHSIYYGDRMLDRLIDQFVKVEGVGMPPTEEFVEQVKAEMAKPAAPGTPVKGRKSPARPPLTRVLDARVDWLKTNLSKATWAKLVEWMVMAVASYGRHEREHARQTTQDMKQVNRDLAALEIPFQLFNLFEDSRIEHFSREWLNAKFDWMVFEDIAPANNPYNMYLRCIQLEGERDDAALDDETPFDKDGTRTIGHVADSVMSYYHRACKCTTSEQLYPIIKEFLEEFKDDMPPLPPPPGGSGGGGAPGSGSDPGKGKGEGKPGEDEESAGGKGEGESEEDEYNGAGERAGDLSLAAEAADKGDEFFTEFESGIEVVGGTDPEGKAADAKAKAAVKGDRTPSDKDVGKSHGQGIPESIIPDGEGGRGKVEHFLTSKAGEIDPAYQKRVDNLTAMLMQMFKSHTLPAALETPGRRMSGRHLAHGEIRHIHKRVFGGKGKRKYSVIYDCSGSMSGRPDREGKLFLLAMNNLAKRGFLEGSLILSGFVGGRPSWISYPFPVKDEIIMRIHPHHSAEGLQTALEHNLPKIQGMDDVFVYTDANICDTPINRGLFAKRRVWPVGLYVGKEEMASIMEEHFPQNIIRDTIEELVKVMLTRNRRTVG